MGATSAVLMAMSAPACSVAAELGENALAITGADTATMSTFAEAPSMMMPRWQLYTGLVAGLFPVVIAAFEFGKRWLIQLRCETCGGTGLVTLAKTRRKVKCRECGGFLPWESWELFLSSEAGNGGPLRQPKGQTSIFYKVPPPSPAPPPHEPPSRPSGAAAIEPEATESEQSPDESA